MIGTIPVMRENYSIPQLFKSIFVSESSRHTERLKELIRIFFSVKDVRLVSSARYPILVKDKKRFIEHCRFNHVAVGTGYNRLYCLEDCKEAY